MSKTTIHFIILAIVLLALQVLVLNRVCLWGVAMAFAFIYVIFHLPLTLSQNWVLTIAFFLGLTVDIFSDTQGMNSLACTLTAALRRPVLKLYFNREEDLTDPSPSVSSLGFPVFAKYAVSLTLIYCTLIFLIEAFTFFNVVQLGLRIAGSTLLTSLVILAIDSIVNRPNEKRL